MADTSPRPELLALLAAVKADPDDDTAKLVLADWLQEQDHEADRARGEYIRELLQWQQVKWDEIQALAYLGRYSGYHRQYQRAWFGNLIDVGFACLNHLDRAEWAIPLLCIGGARVLTKAAMRVATTEQYSWVAGLSFDSINDAQLSEFAKSPLLDPLIALDLRGRNLTESGIANFMTHSRVSGLKYIDLSGVPVPVAAISSSPSLAGLRELDLVGADLDDTRFKLLCDSQHLNQLRSLKISGSFTIHSARAFSDGTGLPSLVQLELSGSSRIGPDGTLILVANPNSSRLRKLNLVGNSIADYGVEAICRQAHMCNLTHLGIAANLLTNRAAIALARTEHLATLQELILTTNDIGDEGALALAHSPYLGNIHLLHLGRNPIGEEGRDALRERFGDRVKV